jgi:uncharacterized protein (TIGR00106 family)
VVGAGARMIVAEFRVIPVGEGSSMHEPMRHVEEILRDAGVRYEMGALGTTLEAERAEEIFAVVRACHARLRSDAERIVTEVILDERIDKEETIDSLKEV